MVVAQESLSTPALLELNKTVLSATQHALLVTTESVQSVGNPAHQATPMKVLSAQSTSISMAKAAAAQSSVAAVVAELDTLTTVALAEDLPIFSPRRAKDVVLELQWVAPVTKISMVGCVTQSAKLDIPELDQSAGKIALETLLILESAALSKHTVVLPVSQWFVNLVNKKTLHFAILPVTVDTTVLVQCAGGVVLQDGLTVVLVAVETLRSVLIRSSI